MSGPRRDGTRTEALATAARAAAAACRAPDHAGIAVVAYDEGHLVLAVAGVVGDRAGDRLLALLPGLRLAARYELDVDLSALTRSSPALLRFLGYARLQQVSGHGRLTLHRPPTELVSALGEPGPDQVLVHDPRPAVRAL
ncbi:hypothetical protein [Actinomycetospora cinnamomea]|uniref:STAS domain-containing protein n=1 Tax=Actinomycetospora cinnamomea TaxID=663609 RepID=A0A2U1EZM1_9PSEU|nr:hypothetical protein [Actinomycetospora cinnamomea]PVZ05384.1 hypothetical protein C8D89_11589 [Actinomycetospora cinnamomea]